MGEEADDMTIEDHEHTALTMIREAMTMADQDPKTALDTITGIIDNLDDAIATIDGASDDADE